MPAFTATSSKAVEVVVAVNEEDIKVKVVAMEVVISPDTVNFSTRKGTSEKLLVS